MHLGRINRPGERRQCENASPGPLNRSRPRKANFKMKQSPSFPKYAKDWLTGEGTRLMTPEQRGAFDWLLCHAWLSDPPCTLPDDDAALAKLSDLGRRWKTVGGAIRAQFIPHSPGRIVNRKLLVVWNEYQEFRDRQSRSGKRGNESRWQSDRSAIEYESPNDRTAIPEESQNDRSAIAKSSLPLPLPLPLPEEEKNQIPCECLCACSGATDGANQCGFKHLTASQAPIHSVLVALRQHTEHFQPLAPGRVAAWLRDYGEELLLETIHDVGVGLDGKNGSYLQKILRNRKEHPNERPANRTQRRSAHGKVIQGARGRRNPFAGHKPDIEVGGDGDEAQVDEGGQKRTAV